MMKGWLNQDNMFIVLMYKLSYLFLLNVLWVICSIPIVTAGAATAALYTVTLKMAENEESYIARSFWEAFKRNFKQSVVLELIILVTGTFLYLDMYIVAANPIPGGNFYQLIFALAAVFGIIIISYLFPVLSKYDAAVGKIIKVAAYMSFRHIAYTLPIIIISVFPMILVLLIPYLLPYLLILGISGSALLNSYLFNRIFLKYMLSDA